LLDDIFDKLDNSRIERLLAMMSNHAFGQVFLTDARPDRTRELLNSAGVPMKVFSVESGNLIARS
jgi:DNA replication and repair protein RecF